MTERRNKRLQIMALSSARDGIIRTSVRWYDCMGEFIDSNRLDHPDACYEKMEEWDEAVALYKRLMAEME